MRKVSHGGKRANAGRKKLKDKKRQLSMYVRESKIEEYGGEDPILKHLYKSVGIVPDTVEEENK